MKSKTGSALALGASVSVLAFSIAAPAIAGTNAGINEATTSADVNTTLTISNVGEDVLFGVDNAGAPGVSSSVTTTSTGQISQFGSAVGSGTSLGVANVAMVNSGSATVRADAAASNSAGSAGASASVQTGVEQGAFGANGASASLTNNGTLTIQAIASAEALTDGDAYAYIDAGFEQYAYAGGAATASLVNGGTFNVAVTATAQGASEDAGAYAFVDAGVGQYASAGNGDAAASLENTGLLNITATAGAEGAISADASAAVNYSSSDYAIGQDAYAYSSGSSPSGNASVALTNASTGTINIAATADAGANSAYATAEADIYRAIGQYAFSPAGDASVALTNAGSLNISIAATANVLTSGSAYAEADAYEGISQVATTYGDGDASVLIANSGELSLLTDAKANGAAAEASASNENIIRQQVNPYASGSSTGNASVALTNASSGKIDIAANAQGNGNATYGRADAFVSEAVSQNAYARGADASVTLTNAGSLNVTATAVAIGVTSASADASNDSAIQQYAVTLNGGAATVSLTNSGTLDIAAIANAAADGYASANAELSQAVSQAVSAYGGGDATVSLTNSGTLNLVTDATANGANADAYANGSSSNDYFIGQFADAYGTGSTSGFSPSGNASVALTNASSATINIAASAKSNGSVGYGSADASISDAIHQYAYSANGDASVSLTNAGSLNVTANAAAAGATGASAGASNEDAVAQSAYANNGGNVSVLLANSGKLNIAATADAAAGSYADAGAFVYDAILQDARAYSSGSEPSGNASVALTNTSAGTINIGASAKAEGTTGNGYADASVGEAISQFASSEDGDASVALDNGGKINATVDATASGVEAVAYAQVFPLIDQNAGSSSSAVVGNASVSLTNASSGAIKVASNVSASGDVAYGNAAAGGVSQTGNGATTNLAFTNAGTFTVDAEANADGTTTGNAFAGAQGYQAFANAPVLNFANSGTFAVSAKATGTTGAEASVIGAVFGGDTLTGTVSNAGQLTVVANADAPSGTATAAGIFMYSSENSATLNNTGTISASALTTNGASYAAAIVVNAASVTSGTSSGAPFSALAVNEFTINNSGSIVARQSFDDGATWTHGLAIDTTNAPNPAVINLTGNGANAGSIYGNIDISAVDMINVASGETQFDGVVNPGGELEGQLHILSGGTLYLQNAPTANPSYDGPAQVNVDALTIAAGGSLALQLPTGPADGSAYPTITANTANITGATLVIRPSTANGLYADTATFADVIVAGELTGTFASTVSGSPLLALTPTYAGNSVSLNMTRVAFDDVAGLTVNQAAVAGGIEAIYSDTLTGPTATLLGSLFTQTSAGYASSLDQLTGAQYASHLQSLIRLGNRFNDLLGDAGDCAASTEYRQSCRAESGGRIWGKIDYGRVTKDGDVNAPGYFANDWYLALGTDYNVAPNTAVGVGVAYVSHNETFKRNYGEVQSDGFQVGAYAVYDPGQYYFEGVVSYSSLNADSTRFVNIGDTTGTLRGSPDADIWSVSGQTGYRLSAGDKSVVTPYFNLDFASAKLKGFTETGVDAANLVVGSNTHEAWATTLGAKWGGAFRGVVPELNLGWRHQFGDRVALVDAAFGALPGSDFQIISQAEKRDSALVGLSINGRASPQAEFRVEYLGQFNSEFQSHSGGVTLTVRFGG